MFKNYLKIAWRNLLKNKGTSFINITGLAIGMAVAILIGLWVYDEVDFDHYCKNYDRLAQVYLNQTYNEFTGSGNGMSFPTSEAIRTNFTADIKYTAKCFWPEDHLLAYGEKKILQDGRYVDPDFPEMLDLNMIAGNRQNALATPNSVILSQSAAKALFGDEDPMGKTLRADQTTEVQVTGIFRDLPTNSTFQEKIYLPWAILANQGWVKETQVEWDNHFFELLVQLNDEADMEAVSAKIKDIEKDHLPDAGKINPQLFLHPMSRWHLYSKFENGVNAGGRIQYVRLFSIIGIFVLLLACINFMNLSTARSRNRAKEVGIRKSVGSGRGQLVGQFLSESLFVVLLAMVFSMGLVQASLSWFNQLADKKLALPVGEPVFWLLMVGFALLTGLLAGSYPAFFLSSFQPLKVLKGTFSTGRWATLPRQVLVVVQFTVSVVLIVGTLVIFNQIQYAKNRPVGYDRESLLQMTVTSGLAGHFDALRAALLQTGMVEEVSQASSPTTGIWSNSKNFDWDGKDPNSSPLFGIIACSHEFGKTIGWQIKEGRDFSRQFGADSTAFLLNEAAVKLIGWKDPIDKIIRREDKNFRVIGVVKDMVMESPYAPMTPTIFTLNYEWANVINVKLKPGLSEQEALARVEAVFKNQDPASVFDFKFADDEYNTKFESEERIGKLARIFTILAIFISCLGLFGLSACVAEQRTKEIGIRKVLGATIAHLWAMQSRSFVGLVLISSILATPIAWYFLNGWLKDYEYRIDLGMNVFFIAGILAVAVTLFTVSFQSIRAALANPVESLRSE